MEQRASIKFCVKLGKTFTETLGILRKAYAYQVPSRTTIYGWFKRFKERRKSLDDDERRGRPASSRTDKPVEKIREMIRKDRYVFVTLIEDVAGIEKS